MAEEIERKFLVKGNYKHLTAKKNKIIQAYLSVDPERTVRIRISSGKACLTIKGKGRENSFTRTEWEVPVRLSDAREIMKICLPGQISKTRYYIPWGKHTIEVDEFHEGNKGLVLAEVELSSEDEEFIKPEWLGEEVTGRHEYYNVNLIK
jgi:adenylate cyclase